MIAASRDPEVRPESTLLPLVPLGRLPSCEAPAGLDFVFEESRTSLSRSASIRRVNLPPRSSNSFWSTLALMRRLWAAILVAMFSFTLIGPAGFADGSERTLPACCRSNGKHHCSLSRHREDSGPALSLGHCPAFGGDQIAPQLPSAGIAKGSETSVPAQSLLGFAPPTTNRLVHRHFDYSGLKRGPPSLS